MHEEGKAYLGWEKIKDFIRNEEHRRVNDDNNRTDTPLSKLKNDEFRFLRWKDKYIYYISIKWDMEDQWI